MGVTPGVKSIVIAFRENCLANESTKRADGRSWESATDDSRPTKRRSTVTDSLISYGNAYVLKTNDPRQLFWRIDEEKPWND